MAERIRTATLGVVTRIRTLYAKRHFLVSITKLSLAREGTRNTCYFEAGDVADFVFGKPYW